MDGVINIYKPAGISSFTCVSRVRRLTASERAGHAGTLDPQRFFGRHSGSVIYAGQPAACHGEHPSAGQQRRRTEAG